MFDPGIVPVVQSLIDVDVSTADRGELDRAVAMSERIRAWLDAGDVAVARRAKQLATADPTSTSSKAEARDTLSNGGRREERDTRAAATRAELCERMPGFETGLVDGSISAGHVDAMAAATRGLDAGDKAAVDGLETELVDAATNSTVAQFRTRAREIVEGATRRDDGAEELERQRRRRRFRRWTDRDTGMWKGLIEVDPVTGAKLSAAIDAKVAAVRRRGGNATADGVTFDHIEVDALVELVTGPGTSGTTAAGTGTGTEKFVDPDLRRVPEVCVHVDLATLLDGTHAHGLCELADGTPLPVSTVLRLCCEADIVPIVIGLDGQPVDAGRAIRRPNRKQRRLLRAMYRTCAHPTCTITFDRCEIHHIVPWERLGPTDIANLLPLCAAHHHLVHEGRWMLAMTPDRVITLRRPDGTVDFTGCTTDRSTGRADDQDRRLAPSLVAEAMHDSRTDAMSASVSVRSGACNLNR